MNDPLKCPDLLQKIIIGKLRDGTISNDTFITRFAPVANMKSDELSEYFKPVCQNSTNSELLNAIIMGHGEDKGKFESQSIVSNFSSCAR